MVEVIELRTRKRRELEPPEPQTPEDRQRHIDNATRMIMQAIAILRWNVGVAQSVAMLEKKIEELGGPIGLYDDHSLDLNKAYLLDELATRINGSELTVTNIIQLLRDEARSLRKDEAALTHGA